MASFRRQCDFIRSPAVKASAATKDDPQAFWQIPLEGLLLNLDTDGGGLSAEEAGRRLRLYGPNQLARKSRFAGFFTTARQIVNPLILILLCASAVSAVVGEVVNAVVIAVMVVLSIAVDAIQTHRSSKAAEQLRSRVESKATVLRDSQSVDVSITAVVPGDRILLGPGDVVPADARVIDSNYFLLDEAAFTGESLPVEKSPSERVESDRPTDASNAVFMGTTVFSGNGEVLAVNTGGQTTYAALASQLEKHPPETAFDRGLRGFGFLIARTVAVLIVFVLTVNLLAERPLLESLLFAIALAVGLTPEFLPMILAVTQAQGALEMAKSRVIVRQLSAIQNFGNLDIICSDKTGTLTEGRLAVERFVSFGSQSDDDLERLAFANAVLATDTSSPFDRAIAAKEIDIGGFHKVGELPFDFERRRQSVVVEAGDRRLLICKGAPESVFSVAASHRNSSQVQSIDTAALARFKDTADSLGSEGLRLLAVATRELPPGEILKVESENGLTLEGLVAFRDPPKADVGRDLAALRQDGIILKVITGDAVAVTRRICQDIGIQESGRICTGDELKAMDDEVLAETVREVDVFARVAPEEKLRIIRVLQIQGHVVGYLGDGINDAPALRAADVGISVAGAVDVARESSEIVLLEKSLAVLHTGVIEGRKVFGNVTKYIMMGTSSNFGNMLSMAGAVLFLPFLPLLPSQILLNNALYDFAQISIPTDRVDEEMIRRPRGWDMRFIRDFMLVFGPISSIFDFLTFFVLRSVLGANAELFHTGWFVESLATQTLVIFVIRTRGNPLKSRPSIFLATTVVLIVSTAALLPWSPLAHTLGFVGPPLRFVVFVAAAVAAYLVIVEAVKRVFYRLHPFA